MHDVRSCDSIVSIMSRLRVRVLGATQLYVELITGGTFAGDRAAKACH